jgi:hypothetical protein
VRALYSADGGRTLRPFETVVDKRFEPLVFFLAAEVDGYWGEAFRTAAGDEELLALVSERLDTVAAGLRPGMAVASISEQLGRLPGTIERHHAVAGHRAVARLGLVRDDGFGVASGAKLTPGVYSLRAGGRSGGAGALLSRTVEVGVQEPAT